MGVKGWIAWRFVAEKINVVTLRAMVAGIIALQLSSGKTPKEIAQYLKDLGRLMGEWIYRHYLEIGKASLTIADWGKDFNLGFKFFTGKEFDDIWYEVSDDGKYVELHMRIYNNPTSKGLQSPSREIKIDSWVAGIFEWIEQMRMEEWGAEELTVDEIKCRAAGDPYCEFVFKVRLRDEGAEKVLRILKPGTTIIKGSKKPKAESK